MDGVAEVSAVLQRSFLVCGLTPEQVTPIASLGRHVQFRPGDHLINLGCADCDLYVLVHGQVSLLTQDGDKLGEVGPAGVLGEISFVDAGPRHAHAVAITEVSAIQFPAKDLRKTICQDRQAGFLVLSNIARLLATRLRAADYLVDELSDHHKDVWHHAMG